MTFTASTKALVVDPLASAAIGVWRIKITQTVVSGADSVTNTVPAFESITLTVTCSVTAFANPGAPSLADRTYSIYSPMKSIDLAATWAL